jgi:Gram-negative bacterial TonB protein C-terminal
MNLTIKSAIFFSGCLLLSANGALAQSVTTPSLHSPNSPAAAALQELVSAYDRGSDLVRPGLAVQIRRQVRSLERDASAATAVAKGRIVLSRQAAIEDRKDLALREAQAAGAIAGSIAAPEGKALRAQAAVVTAQALLLKEEYLRAATTIITARQAYGRASSDADQPWDELALWQSIIKTVTPPRLQTQASALYPSAAEETGLLGLSKVDCMVNDKQIRKILGDAPVYPVNSLSNGRVGGVAIRSTIDAQGVTKRANVTAFAPTEGFAAAAETAALTWRYEIPAGLPEQCRNAHLTIISFGIRP